MYNSNRTLIAKHFFLVLLPAVLLSFTAANARAQSSEDTTAQQAAEQANQGGLLDVLERQKKAIVGSWQVTQTYPDLLEPFNTTKLLAAFTGDGIYLSTMQGESAATEDPLPPATPQFGTWQHVGGRQFVATYKIIFYRLATGAFFGTAKIPLNITINEAGDAFTGTGRFEAFDADGHIIFSVSFTLQATRIKVEPLN
jgi:hypothetical protein